jgi:hypothetical protein
MTEAEIQDQFVLWLKTKGYEEYFRDPNGGAGAKMDSMGLLKDRPLLIEFKKRVDARGVRYSKSNPSSIERKVCNSLITLFGVPSVIPAWSRRTVPEVWVVAERFSKEATNALSAMLEKRSYEWYFKYKFGEWNGTSFASLGFGPARRVSVTQWGKVKFPLMPWPGQKRRPTRGLDEHRAIAVEMGVEVLFDEMLRHARRLSLPVSCHRGSINLGSPSAVGVWAVDSGAKGLCVATHLERAAQIFGGNACLNPLPGTAAPTRGYLGPRRFLISVGEVEEYWRTLAPSR